MVKKVFTIVAAAAAVTAACSAVYADSCGAFQKDTDAAMRLVDKYMNTVMRSYRGDEDVSFRGIVKEGCDFWYYNDYNNDLICKMSRNAGTAQTANFSVSFESVKYSNFEYTIDAEIRQTVEYKNGGEPITTVCKHTFTIEQDNRGMRITDDVCDGTDKLLVPPLEVFNDPTETNDIA